MAALSRRNFMRGGLLLVASPAIVRASNLMPVSANTLDDYEEGTFTPGMDFGGECGVRYENSIGHYTKAGNTVFVTVRFELDARDPRWRKLIQQTGG